VKKLFLLKYWIIWNFLRLGDPKLSDLANLWSYKCIMTEQNFNNIQLWRHFDDVIKLRHLKYVIKMTSQFFPIFKPPHLLSKILVALLPTVAINRVGTVNANVMPLYKEFEQYSTVPVDSLWSSNFTSYIIT